MNRFDTRILAEWVENNLDACTNPRVFGKGLVANHSGEWRHRVGVYRVLVLIHDDTIAVKAFLIGRRDKIYMA